MINSTAYYNDFWNEMRGMEVISDSLSNVRESKTNACPLLEESEKKYMAALKRKVLSVSWRPL